jgi:AbrB family looped-hinge helix DNA binding protein
LSTPSNGGKGALGGTALPLRTKFGISDILISEIQMKTVVMGRRGTLVVPAQVRRRFRLEEGTPLTLEEREDGILIRPVRLKPPEVEVYTPQRLAEFFLNNAMDREDYLEARKEVAAMGLDPDSVDHLRWPE